MFGECCSVANDYVCIIPLDAVIMSLTLMVSYNRNNYATQGQEIDKMKE